jgi:hypothetical protein
MRVLTIAAIGYDMARSDQVLGVSNAPLVRMASMSTSGSVGPVL